MKHRFLPTTLIAKLWHASMIVDYHEGRGLVHVDRHLLHDLTSPQAFAGLRAAGRRVRHSDLTMAVADHVVATNDVDRVITNAQQMIAALRANTAAANIPLFDIGDLKQGIVHVTAAEEGIVLPGMTVVCGDSHTCTLGALGSWAFGIGTSDVEHVLATQTLVVKRPAALRIIVEGHRPAHVTAKDLALAIIARLGVDFGMGGVIEYAGPAISAMTMDERFTLCNMGIELGARSAIIAPDETTFAYLASRSIGPRGIGRYLPAWRQLRTDPGAQFVKDIRFDWRWVAPQISWGTNPGQTIGIDEVVPDPSRIADQPTRDSAVRALDYMGLRAGTLLTGTPIDVAFIGSCTNARLSDLQDAAAIIRGRRVAPHVRALVVPGSARIKHQAEELGLDTVFQEAGFEWRRPGCSMCIGMNGDVVGPAERCISTSNRNFEGRQGNRARTHLASPKMVAAAAIAGTIVDARDSTVRESDR